MRRWDPRASFAVDNDARGIAGTYHNVSKKYLPLYLAEFSFRFNNRHNPDIFGSAIAGC